MKTNNKLPQPAQPIPCQTAEESRVGAASGDKAGVEEICRALQCHIGFLPPRDPAREAVTEARSLMRELAAERDALRKEVAARSDNESALAMQLRESRSDMERLKYELQNSGEAWVALTDHANDLRAQLATAEQEAADLAEVLDEIVERTVVERDGITGQTVLGVSGHALTVAAAQRVVDVLEQRQRRSALAANNPAIKS